MESIKALLESEMEASREFTSTNFGLKVGDDFPEIVREIVKSPRVANALLMTLATGPLYGPGFVKDLQPINRAEDAAPAILRHLEAFETPLAMLYWGIQIGRKLERDEMKAMQKMSEPPATDQ